MAQILMTLFFILSAIVIIRLAYFAMSNSYSILRMPLENVLIKSKGNWHTTSSQRISTDMMARSSQELLLHRKSLTDVSLNAKIIDFIIQVGMSEISKRREHHVSDSQNSFQALQFSFVTIAFQPNLSRQCRFKSLAPFQIFSKDFQYMMVA